MVRPIDFSRCAMPAGCERRLFWATQADACGTVEDCGDACGTPGLLVVETDDPGDATRPFATISTANWVEGLALNILLTDRRKDSTECGWLPGRLGGHWSEAFIGGGNGRVGSRIRFPPATGSIAEQLQAIETYAQADLEKLVTYGVATKVKATAAYLGRAKARVDVAIYGQSGATVGRVGINAQRSANSWVWAA